MQYSPPEIDSLIKAVLKGAIAERASEVHLRMDGTIAIANFTVGEKLKEQPAVPKGAVARVVTQLKLLAKSGGYADKRSDIGSFVVQLSGRRFSVQVATRSTKSGEILILRIEGQANPR